MEQNPDDEAAAIAATLTLEGAEKKEPRTGASVEPGTRVDRYVVERRLGEGGMGIVYLAEDRELGRRVALKFLRSDGSVPRFATRLQREAQAMAKLSHPNVATVYDVGTYFGQMFLTMPFIEGGTIRSRLQGMGDWRSKWKLLRAAGAGLAAAHAAGIVHRDFKPDNVLVSAEGVAMVTDFGLARSVSDSDSADGAAIGSAAKAEVSLTRTGAIVGTPKYMAPEQHRGQPAGPAADQFAFAVTVWELLIGDHPFRGDDAAALASAVTEGKRRPVPEAVKVPLWFRKVLDRALSSDPADRFASLEEMLAALDRDPARLMRRAALIGAVAVLAALVVYLGFIARSSAVAACSDGADRWAGVWDEPTSSKVREAFRASNRPHAETSWQLVARAFDDHSREWKAQYLDNCRATHQRSEQSVAMFDKRQACLEQRRAEVRGLVSVFLSADQDPLVVDRALGAVNGMLAISNCDDPENLAKLATPTNGEIRTQAADLYDDIGEARAVWLAGRYQEAYDRARDLVSRADALEFAPTRAQALNLLGVSAFKLRKLEEAEAVLKKTIEVAARGGDSAAELEASLVLLEVIVHEGVDLGRADLAIQMAQTAMWRARPEPNTEARFENQIGVAYHMTNRFERAAEHARKAATLWERTDGRMYKGVATAKQNLASALQHLGRTAEAKALYDESLEIRLAVQGEHHPEIAFAYVALAEWYSAQDDCEGALRYHQLGQRVREENFGPDNLILTHSLKGIGWCSAILGRHAEAIEAYTRVIKIEETSLGPDKPQLSDALSQFGAALFMAGRRDEAVEKWRKAAALAAAGGKSFALDAAIIEVNTGLALLEMDRPNDAERSCAAALRVFQSHEGALPYTREAQKCRGKALLGLRRFAQAEELLRTTLASFEAEEASALDTAETQFLLGRALWGAGKQAPARGEARRALARLGDEASPTREAIERWLAHPE